MDVDPAQLAEQIVSLLEPFLPAIVEDGKKADKPAFEKLNRLYSVIPWGDAKKLWKRLRKRLEAQAPEFLQAFIQNPSDETALADLRLQINKTLTADSVFATDAAVLVEKMQVARRVPASTSSDEDEIKIIGSSGGFTARSGGHQPVEKNVPAHLDKVASVMGKKYFKISVSHPVFLSKRFASPFLVQLYFEELNAILKEEIKRIIGGEFNEHVYHTDLKLGQTVKVKLYSPDIIFPEPVAKRLDASLNAMTFLGKPSDTCQVGEHKVVLSILDNKSDLEYRSEAFTVKVVDFAFDHVSRPLLSRVSAVVLGVGSFAMFILTFLEQIDKTVGLTSGTAAGVLAAVVYANFYSLYQRIHPSTP